MTTTYEQLGQQIGALTDEKNAAYGSSFAKCGEYLRLLYPNGIRPEQYIDVLLLARDFDKNMRIATAKNAFGESPYRDKAGYALLGAQLHAEGKEQCGSVNEAGAAGESQELNDSAAKSASEPTTPTANDKSEPTPKPPSTKPSPDTSASMAASAPCATASASASEAVLLSASCDAIVTCLRNAHPKLLTTSKLKRALGVDFDAPVDRCTAELLRLRFIVYSPEGYLLTQAGFFYWNRRETLI